MAKIIIGGNEFINCSFPLALNNKYFLIEEGAEHLFTVFNIENGKVITEIFKNEPQDNPYTRGTKNATGIITVCDNQTGNFIYKIRPGSKSSEIFGRIVDEEEPIIIKDNYIEYKTHRFQGCGFYGQVGIKINADGTTRVAALLPQELKDITIGN